MNDFYKHLKNVKEAIDYFKYKCNGLILDEEDKDWGITDVYYNEDDDELYFKHGYAKEELK